MLEVFWILATSPSDMSHILNNIKKNIPNIREKYVPIDKRMNPEIHSRKLERVTVFGDMPKFTNAQVKGLEKCL